MKTRILIFALALVFGLFTSCDKEDKNESQQSNTVVGSYSLMNVSGGLMGANVNFTKGEIQWSFNTTSNILTVNNSIDTTDSRYSFSDLPSGTYTYQFQTQNSQQVLFVGGTERGPIAFTSNGWNLDDGIPVDGFLIKFEK